MVRLSAVVRRMVALALVVAALGACSGDDAVARRPLIVALHATGSNATRFEEISRLREHAPGAVVTFVEGVDGRWSPGDVARVAEIVDELVADGGVDPERVHLVGFSGGGAMALRIAALDGSRYRAVAAVASQLPKDVTPASEVPVVVLYGRDDPLRPFEGLDDSPVPTTGTVATAQAFAGDDTQPVPERLPDLDPDDGTTVQRLSWRTHAPVDLYVVDGGGHTWPGTPVATNVGRYGRTSRDIDASEVIVDFFAEHGALTNEEHE